MLLILEKLKFLLKIKQVVVWKEECLFFLHNLASLCGLNLNRINLNKLKNFLCIKAFVKMQPQASHSYFYATFFAACIQCALFGGSKFCKRKTPQNYAIDFDSLTNTKLPFLPNPKFSLFFAFFLDSICLTHCPKSEW